MKCTPEKKKNDNKFPPTILQRFYLSEPVHLRIKMLNHIRVYRFYTVILHLDRVRF